MRRAREEAEKLQKQAQDLKQQKMAENAGSAAEDIRKAENAKDRETADKHLKDALQKLGSQEKADPQKDQKDQKGQKDQEQDQQNRQDNREPQDPRGGARPEPGNAELDKESAAKLLEAMANQEKQLRDQLKERARQRQYKVEKDW